MHLYNIDCIVGARPNFVKIAPIMRALSCRNGMKLRLIHTGQHYDIAMSAVFFDDLAIPSPDINLEVGSGTHTEQTARIMMALEPVLVAQRPDLVLVVGDVNSTMAASLAAAKLNIPVAHVEAGLRSFDRTMPEEINRVVTDRLSDLLLATEPSAVDNLVKEGIAAGRIHFVGNVMIDSLHACLDRAIPAQSTLAEMGASSEFVTAATGRGFGFVTLHRPSNVDDPGKLAALLTALVRISRDLCLIFPLHPRTRAVISTADLGGLLDGGAMLATPPLSYLRALGLMREARLVITDSGGVQEETTALGVPCLTVRDNTERPITVQEGTNTLVGTSPDALVAAAEYSLRSGVGKGRIPALWDGRAAARIADCIEAFLRKRSGG
ncbi:UDP-N-acetylglucosamine 2-epimerase (non-hydrolysing) [Rhizobiales bacterium GAS113]|nr:UDP-N-acetylglucosamine 2-epimerase (non-hydrolysing) [Rhizobiales bacterium GAS113]